jgi:hypothetical protein
LKKFFSTGADGQLQPGDSVAVWLVNQQVNGQFPTFAAGATNTGVIVSNLVGYLQRQRYATTSQLAVLQAPLNHVVAGSRRLTVILFTDGQSGIAGTPYDDGVNQTFRDVQADRRKNQQPVVVVMRSQMGKFAGCTLGFPPGDISFPPFPALPAPPVVTNPPKVASPPVPPPAAESLVIVGNKVVSGAGTNQETHVTSANPMIASNPPPAAPATNFPAVAPATNNLAASASLAANNPPPAPAVNPSASAPVATNLPVTAPLLISNPPPAPAAPPAKTGMTADASPAIPPKPETNVAANVASAPPHPPAKGTVVAQTKTLAKGPAPVAATHAVVAATQSPDGGNRIYIYSGVGAVAAAAVLAMIVLGRSRRPDGSLISRSMEDDPQRK